MLPPITEPKARENAMTVPALVVNNPERRGRPESAENTWCIQGAENAMTQPEIMVMYPADLCQLLYFIRRAVENCSGMTRKNTTPAPPCTITGMGVMKCSMLTNECALPSAGGPIAIFASMNIAGNPGTPARKSNNATIDQFVLGLKVQSVATGDELSIIGNLFPAD